MRKLIYFITFLALFQFGFAQTDTVVSEGSSQIYTPYTWQGACCDNNGKPLNPADFSNQVYRVKKFHSKTLIEIGIKSVKLGAQVISLDIYYKNKIEGDTKIINLNDTMGIKVVIGKLIENGIKKYVYKFMVYKRDKKSNCWRPLSNANYFYDVYAQTVSLNLFSIGYPDSKDYFQIVESWIKFD